MVDESHEAQEGQSPALSPSSDAPAQAGPPKAFPIVGIGEEQVNEST
jgi:hypothetical protein